MKHLILCLSLLLALPSLAQEPSTQPSSQPAIDEKRMFTKGDVEYLYSLNLLMPTQGQEPSSLLNTYRIGKKGHHRANDIMAPRNTPLVAITDSVVHRMHHSKKGGITVYMRDTKNGSILYYYAHLSRYADGLQEGQEIKKGDVIGYVGTTGAKKSLPHVHFSIFKAPNPKRWWKVAAINPYYILTGKEYPLDELTLKDNLAPDEP